MEDFDQGALDSCTSIENGGLSEELTCRPFRYLKLPDG
jgi:hypothetical protein